MKHLVLIPACVFLLCLLMPYPTAADGVYFRDSVAAMIVLGNARYYEVGIRKSNGSIAYVTDKSTGQRVTLGSRYGCLWGAVFPTGSPDFVGGCSFNAGSPNGFRYTWSAPTSTLTMDYTPNLAVPQGVAAQVRLVVSPEPWFDLRLQLRNDWGYTLERILFPCDLVFAEADMGEVLLPILPGIVLKSGFFAQHRSYGVAYPGWPGMFADYVSISTRNGQVAIYTLSEPNRVHPVDVSFTHDDAYVASSTYYGHAFAAQTENGRAWSSPEVRIRVSQSARATIAAYREDNGLSQFGSLQEKSGWHYEHIAQSPLLKADAGDWAVSQYPVLLSIIPTPAILHPVGYQPRGFDENYPDFLPPNQGWGSTANLAAMFRQAQARSVLVMPYINPTWWDDESPTLRNLPAPLNIQDVAVLNEQGSPKYEYYGVHGGYVVSPHVPFVQQRLAQLLQQVTTELPSDLVFEDQIGARNSPYDYNRSSPSPTAYLEGWLDHTRTYSDTLLMTEMGFDRLVETEVGFHGSVLLVDRRGEPDGWWGATNWSYYPFATMVARDKILFYQHDLAWETMTTDKATLTWNMAFGYMLSYDLLPEGLYSPWLGLVSTFQKHVLARYVDERVTDFINLDNEVTKTSFETVTVIANWDRAHPHSVGEHVLPPLGVMVASNDGRLTAGVFSSYNGALLNPGDHYLIEERGLDHIVVRQPVGSDTNVVVRRLPAWDSDAPLQAYAYDAAGQVLQRLAASRSAQGITFNYQQEVAGKPVSYYRVSTGHGTFLPLISR